MKMEGMSETVNLFDCLVRANTILFHYTTPDGRDEMVYGHEIEMYTVEQGEKRDKRQ